MIITCTITLYSTSFKTLCMINLILKENEKKLNSWLKEEKKFAVDMVMTEWMIICQI